MNTDRTGIRRFTAGAPTYLLWYLWLNAVVAFVLGLWRMWDSFT